MEEYFHMMIALILFLAAMGICITGNRTLYETIMQKQVIYNDTILFEKSSLEEDEFLSGDAVLAKLFYPADISMQLCQSDRKMETIKKDMVGVCVLQDIASIRGRKYRVEYEYDNVGKCVCIKFVEKAE